MIAKSIAAYHVVIGGWNRRRPRTVWNATKKAKPASKPGKPSKHRKGPPKPKAAGGSKTKVKP